MRNHVYVICKYDATDLHFRELQTGPFWFRGFLVSLSRNCIV